MSFVFSVTAQEILGSCVFLFVKHPLDVGDTVYLNTTSQAVTPDQLIVEHVSLLYTTFKRVNSARSVQIPNNVLNSLWVENVSRSKAMREQLSIYVDFGTTFEDIQLLRNEMTKFVTDKDNIRDFQPNVEIEVVGIGKMDSMELRIEIQHKSNWANESVRASRRSRFMCALVLALRKVPIYGPSGSGPALGEMGNPTYSVAIADAIATQKRDEAAREKEAKRMVPSATTGSTTTIDSNATLSPTMSEQADFSSRLDHFKTNLNNEPDSNTSSAPLATIQETRAVDLLNERAPGQDTARDFGSFRADTNVPLASAQPRPSTEHGDLEEVRGILRTATTRGRRRSGTTSSNIAPHSSTHPPGYSAWQAPSGVRRSGTNGRNAQVTGPNNAGGIGGGNFALQDTTAPYIYPSASAPAAVPAYNGNQDSNADREYPMPSQTAYYGAGGPPPPQMTINTSNSTHEPLRPPPQAAVPMVGRQQIHDGAGVEDDLRGENEEEEPLGGMPKMTAGGAWIQNTWRSG